MKTHLGSTLPLAALLLAACATHSKPAGERSALFNYIDHDKDGRISRDEFIDWNTGRLFKIYDKNGDGVVDIEEFRAVQGPGNDLEFHRIDRHHDGKITLEEAKADPAVRNAMASTFRFIDANHDGFISRQEAASYVQRRDALIP